MRTKKNETRLRLSTQTGFFIHTFLSTLDGYEGQTLCAQEAHQPIRSDVDEHVVPIWVAWRVWQLRLTHIEILVYDSGCFVRWIMVED